MDVKKNLPFVIAIAVIGVIFVAVAVMAQRMYAGWSKVKQDDKQTDQERGDLRRKVPTPEHRGYAKDQLAKTEQEFERLKQTLLVWWDAGIYREDRTPGIFLGNLQELRRRITLFATAQGVQIEQNVPLMGFNELATNVPPTDVTFDMLKQKSMMRDIILLLIQEKVYSINGIQWLGPQKGGKLYSKYLVTVTFTCRYPQLAKFQADLVKSTRTQVVLRGEKSEKAESFELPRNYLVIEQLSYSASDLKMARLAAAGTPAGTDTTGTGTYPPGSYGHQPNTSSTIREPGRLVPEADAALGGRPRPDTAPGTNPYARTTPSYTGSMRPPGAGGPGAGTLPPGAGGATGRQEPKRVGREPLYNPLTVTMTISMVDFGEAIRGKLPVEEKKPAGSSSPASQPTGGQ